MNTFVEKDGVLAADTAYEKIVRNPARSRVFETITPSGKKVAWMRVHSHLDNEGARAESNVRKVAHSNGQCNTCTSRAVQYACYSGRNGALFFEREALPVACSQINDLRKLAIETCSREHTTIMLVCEGTFAPPKYSNPRGKNTGEFFHWTIVPDSVTDASLVERMTLLWSKINSSVIERLSKFLSPNARMTMEIIRKVLKSGTLQRPEYWTSTCDWILEIQKKFSTNFENMSSDQKEELCVFAMATGSCSSDVHFNFQTSANFIDFMFMESEKDVADAMDSRSNPRTNQVSQLARAKANHGVTTKYGVGLIWDGNMYKDDLDIHVITPWGKVWFAQKVLPNGNAKLDFDAGISGKETEPAENVSFIGDTIVGSKVGVYIDMYNRRSICDVHCTIVITQLGRDDLVIPVVWAKDRSKGNLLHVCDHTFTAVEVKDPEMSEKQARAAVAQSNEFDEMFGRPTSVVATTDDLKDAGCDLLTWNLPKIDFKAAYEDSLFPHEACLSAIREFDSLAIAASKSREQAINKSGKGGKSFLNQRMANRLPTTLKELSEYMSKSNGNHDLSIHGQDHVPGYVVRVNTKSDNALKNGKNSILASCHFEEKFKHPIKPFKQGNARIDRTWAMHRGDWRITVTGITVLDGNTFFVLDGAVLPNNDDFPLSAGFYPQDLSVDAHKHRSKWAFLNIALKPQMPTAEQMAVSAPVIGTFVTGDTATVYLDSKKLVLTV